MNFRPHVPAKGDPITRSPAWRAVLVAALLVAWLCPPPASAAPGMILPVPYLSQYTGLPSEESDCGPTVVAMIVKAYGKQPPGMSDIELIADIRKASGGGLGGADFDGLLRVIESYGLTYRGIRTDATPKPETQLQHMKDAIDAGLPVMAYVDGQTLGRDYWGHVVVLKGYDDANVYVNDPDDSNEEGWKLPGGDVAWPWAQFVEAAQNTASGPYGLIIGPGLFGPPTPTPTGNAPPTPPAPTATPAAARTPVPVVATIAQPRAYAEQWPRWSAEQSAWEPPTLLAWLYALLSDAGRARTIGGPLRGTRGRV